MHRLASQAEAQGRRYDPGGRGARGSRRSEQHLGKKALVPCDGAAGITRAERTMIGRLNHVAIAVKDVQTAAKRYRDTLGAEISDAVPQPDHGVTTIFIDLPNTKIELLEPLGADSPIAKFLERNPDGGIHHICYEVEDIRKARDQMKAQ